MKDLSLILIPLLLVSFSTSRAFAYSCSWKTIDCHQDEIVCNDKESVLLNSKIPINSNHCLAIKDMNYGKFRNYEIEVDMLSLESYEGQNSGHLGIIFNYLDQSNYDFVYLEYVC